MSFYLQMMTTEICIYLRLGEGDLRRRGGEGERRLRPGDGERLFLRSNTKQNSYEQCRTRSTWILVQHEVKSLR